MNKICRGCKYSVSHKEKLICLLVMEKETSLANDKCNLGLAIIANFLARKKVENNKTFEVPENCPYILEYLMAEQKSCLTKKSADSAT